MKKKLFAAAVMSMLAFSSVSVMAAPSPNVAPIEGEGGENTSPETGMATGALVVTLLASGGVAIASRKKISE